MMKPEACANCGSPDISGWITGKPSSFKRSPRHKDREMLYLCPSCFEKEMSTRNLKEDQLGRRVRWQFGGNSPYVHTGQFGKP
jgi:ribosomal protein L34E